MLTATFTLFRRNASKFLDLVESGESIAIIRHGKPIAKLSPISAEDIEKSWQREPLQLSIKGVSLSKAILNDRNKSRS